MMESKNKKGATAQKSRKVSVKNISKPQKKLDATSLKKIKGGMALTIKQKVTE